MLRLQIASSHVRVGFEALVGEFLSLLQVILVDDLEGEGFKDGVLEIFVDGRRVVSGDQAHVSGERKVKIEDTTIGAVTSLIVNVTIRTNIPPGVGTIYFCKPLIHTRRYDEK